MKLSERAKVVRAMELLARSVNNEEFFMNWLAGGVADGDITGQESDEDLACYCDDETFSELMLLFLYIMSDALKDGGLYVDDVVSKEDCI